MLLQRSGKAGTYQGKWAGVSGYLEEGGEPLVKAMTEIREEVALAPRQVEFVRAGKPLRAFD